MPEAVAQVTGVSAVNARGELALFVEPLPKGARPTLVRQRDNRLAVVSGGTPVSVRVYGDRAREAARAKSRALVIELDEATQDVVRVSDVPVERE